MIYFTQMTWTNAHNWILLFEFKIYTMLEYQIDTNLTHEHVITTALDWTPTDSRQGSKLEWHEMRRWIPKPAEVSFEKPIVIISRVLPFAIRILFDRIWTLEESNKWENISQNLGKIISTYFSKISCFFLIIYRCMYIQFKIFIKKIFAENLCVKQFLKRVIIQYGKLEIFYFVINTVKTHQNSSKIWSII